MSIEQPPLNRDDAGARLPLPAGNPLAGMNPAYIAARGLVALGTDGDRLIVGMADSGDSETLAALRFATGREIDAVQIETTPEGPAPAQAEDASPIKASLTDRIHGWLRADADHGAPLAMALATVPDAAAQPALLARLVAAGTGLEQSREKAQRVQVEVALLAIPAVLAWLALSALAGALALGLAVAALAALRKASALRQDNDGVRAHVLTLAACLIEAGSDQPAAVRAALLRLHDLVPTWGELPASVEGLAQALRLDPQQKALLVAPDTASGLRLVAGQCAAREAQALARRGWLVRLLTVAAFGAALALRQL